MNDAPNQMTEFLNALWEFIISNGGGIIALASLFLSVSTFRIQRNHYKRIVEPLVDLNLSYDEDEFRLTLKNSGFGPAIVTHCYFRHKDSGIRYSSGEVLEKEFGGKYKFRFLGIHEGLQLSPSECHNLFFSISHKESRHDEDYLSGSRKLINNYIIHFDYYGLYDKAVTKENKDLKEILNSTEYKQPKAL